MSSTQLTNSADVEDSPEISKDGTQNGIDAQTFDISPAWSPDSDRIAFAGEPNIGNGGIGDAGIWLANATGPLDLQQIIFGAGGEPSWSPDGARIAFERDGRVWTMRSDGFDQVDLTDGEDPSWGPKA